MLVEMRTYTLHIAKASEYMRLYQEFGLEPQTKILGNLLGWFTTEIGPLNQVIHMWGYASFEDRLERRKKLFENFQWLEFLNRARPLLISQESKILNPAPFSPIGGDHS